MCGTSRLKQSTGRNIEAALFLTSCLTALVAVVSVGMGLVFGFAMEKGSVHVPSVIRDQMLFSSNRMLSMFLSAAGTSALVIAILKLVRAPTEDAFKEYSTHAKRGGLSLLLGGLILGLGMQLSGSCPGTVWIQAGGLVPKFHLVWAGGLTAALVFSYIHPTLQQSGLFEIGRDFIVRHPQLPDPYGITGFLVAAFFWGVVGIVHLLDPPAVSHGGNVLTQAMWHPAMAGLFVGLLELPAALVWKELFGSSQSYVTLISNLLASVGARSKSFAITILAADLFRFQATSTCKSTAVASITLIRSSSCWAQLLAQ